LVVNPVRYTPTAKQLVVLGHETPLSEALFPAGFGLGTIDQDDPFQRAISERSAAPLKYWPTAKQLVEVVQETFASLDCELVAGDGSIDHVVPFQCVLNAQAGE
jgi:hypothetical protein